MRATFRRTVGNRQGAALALVAVSLVVILGMGALAVDMGMLIKQREDAQRAADAAALAGAAAFTQAKAQDAIVPAKDQAFEYLAKNYVGHTGIDTSGKVSSVVGGNRYITTSAEGTVIVVPDSVKVRVIVRRPAVGTFFARVLGFFNVPVAAKAAAIAATQGAGKCIKPFALPDIWQEKNTNEDKNGNEFPDSGEDWQYDPVATTRQGKSVPADHYRGYQDPNLSNTGTETGWGTSFRNTIADADGNRYKDDWGRQIVLKPNSPSSAPAPGFFQAWDLGASRGGDDYRNNIWSCNPVEIEIGVPYQLDSSFTENGNMIGPTNQGIDSLMKLDSLACWHSFTSGDFTTGEVLRRSPGTSSCNQPYPGWESSERVLYVPLFDPTQIDNGKSTLAFSNLAVFFLEGGGSPQAPIVGRFMFFAKGTGEGEEQGSLIRTPKLVE
jgi:Flp pilus assembly protein TadG